MQLPDRLIQLMKDNRQPALFAGAGISSTAGIPMGRQVINLLKQRYPEALPKPVDEYGYSEAFTAALPGKQHRSARRQLFEELCAGIAPGKEHHLIAHLVQHQAFSIIFTTNFDQLTEIALRTRCTPQPQVYLYDEDIEPFGYSTEIARLVKLHGDFLFDDMANLQEELQDRLRENMRAKLHTYLNKRALVVVGCGGQDSEVMKFLSEVARSENGLKDGLWWLVYDENYKSAMLDSVMIDARNAGKHAEIIGPGNARDFLESICGALEIEPPGLAPFGVGTDGRTLLSNYTHRFGRARQLPTFDEPREFDRARRKAMNQLEKAANTPGVVWLTGGSGSGKTTLLASLTRKLGPQSVFYFDHRFAHRPVHLSLSMDLERFATGLGTPVINPPQFLEQIFRSNVVMIFDDLFSSNPMPEQEFVRELTMLIGFREIIGRGTIILATASRDKELQDWIIQVMKAATGGKNPSTLMRIHIKGALATPTRTAIESLLAGKFGKTLQLMSLLRFAELPEMLSQLCDQPGMQEALDLFEQNKLIDRRGQRYALRDEVQTAIRNSVSDVSALHLTLAKRFETLCPEQPYFRRAQYAIEAEAHYWQAKEFKQALAQLLTVAEGLAAAGERYFVYSTIADYISDDYSKAVLSGLPPDQLVPFSNIAYDAFEYGLIPKDDFAFLQDTMEKVVSERGQGFQSLLQAIQSHRAGDFDTAIAALLRAASEFRAAGNVEYLASVLFDLSVYKLEQVAFSINMEATQQAREWARHSEALYAELGLQEALAKTRDHLATTLIHLGDYEAARQLEEKQRKVHAEAEGFTNEKGVVYGNLFSTNLAVGRFAQAEAYFHQSNLNYSWLRNRRGIFFNLYTLYRWSTQSPENLDRLLREQNVSQEYKNNFVAALDTCLQSLQIELMKSG